jgi:hypothetical protein
VPLLVAALGIGVVGLFTGLIWGPVGEAVKALAAVADGVVGLLPDATDLGLSIPSGWLHGYTLLNTFLPLSEALGLISVILVVVTAGLAARIAVVVWHLIPKPGVGT